MDIEIEEYLPNQYFTEYGEVDGIQTITILNDQSTLHFTIKLNIFNKPRESFAFSFDDRYSANVFYGIMPDTGAAGVSTVGEPQV